MRLSVFTASAIRHPLEVGGPNVEEFLNWLANDRQVAASTHKQALSALIFLYSKVLELQLPWMTEIGRPRVQRRLPVVLSRDELAAVFRVLDASTYCLHVCFTEPACG